jgi:hypothetical protein
VFVRVLHLLVASYLPVCLHAAGDMSRRDLSKNAADPSEMMWKDTTSRHVAYDGSAPMWLPDGKSLLFRGPGDAGLLEAPRIATTRTAQGTSLTRAIGTTWLLTLDPTLAYRTIASGIVPLKTSLDGATVIACPIWVESGAPFELRALDARGNPVRSVTLDAMRSESDAFIVSVNPSCSHIAFVSGGRMRLASWLGDRVALADATDIGPADSQSEPSWGRDSTRVAWSDDHMLYIYCPKAGSRQAIELPGQRLHVPPYPEAWSTDGRYVVAIARTPWATSAGSGVGQMGRRVGIAVVDIANESARIVRPVVEVEDYGPAWSTRGHRLALADASGGIRILDIDSGMEQYIEPVRPLPDIAVLFPGEQALDWGRDDQTIAFAVPYDGIYIIDVPTPDGAD